MGEWPPPDVCWVEVDPNRALVQVEQLPESALDLGVHFPRFPFLNQLRLCHAPGHLWGRRGSVGLTGGDSA